MREKREEKVNLRRREGKKGKEREREKEEKERKGHPKKSRRLKF